MGSGKFARVLGGPGDPGPTALDLDIFMFDMFGMCLCFLVFVFIFHFFIFPFLHFRDFCICRVGHICFFFSQHVLKQSFEEDISCLFFLCFVSSPVSSFLYSVPLLFLLPATLDAEHLVERLLQFIRVKKRW